MSKTKSGFEYTVDPRILTDWRFTTAITKVQAGDNMTKVAGIQEMANLVLGEDQMKKLEEHIAEKNDGFVPAEAVVKEINEIFESAKNIKN